MKTVLLGRSGIEISAVVMGMWQAGQQYWVGVEDSQIISAVGAALDSGVTTFDTAEEYGEGHSEQLLGQALKGRRDQAVILSKVFSNHLKHDQVIEACHRSLKNLQTDRIDLYQIHWPSGSWESEVVPLAETLGALQKLKEEGKIRAIGVSNFSLAQLNEAITFAQIDSLQSPYSLLWRYLESELIPFCEKKKIAVLAYSPLAQGVLTGKFKVDHRFEKGDNRKLGKLVEKETFPAVLKVVEGLRALAQERGVTLAQLALAWVIRRENTAAISGVRNSAQITDNASAGELQLSSDEIYAMEKLAEPINQKFVGQAIPWFWEV